MVIKPAGKKNFLHDYQNRSHLHIGLTNSKGFVVEYDSQGIHRDKTLEWKNCIALSLHGAIDRDVRDDPDWPDYWDMCLEVKGNAVHKYVVYDQKRFYGLVSVWSFTDIFVSAET